MDIRVNLSQMQNVVSTEQGKESPSFRMEQCETLLCISVTAHLQSTVSLIKNVIYTSHPSRFDSHSSNIHRSLLLIRRKVHFTTDGCKGKFITNAECGSDRTGKKKALHFGWSRAKPCFVSLYRICRETCAHLQLTLSLIYNAIHSSRPGRLDSHSS